jgi:hypothetical protein
VRQRRRNRKRADLAMVVRDGSRRPSRNHHNESIERFNVSILPAHTTIIDARVMRVMA